MFHNRIQLTELDYQCYYSYYSIISTAAIIIPATIIGIISPFSIIIIAAVLLLLLPLSLSQPNRTRQMAVYPEPGSDQVF